MAVACNSFSQFKRDEKERKGEGGKEREGRIMQAFLIECVLHVSACSTWHHIMLSDRERERKRGR